MQTTWTRAWALETVGRRAWQYLSASASPEDVAAAAENLFSLDRHQLRRLAAAHLGADHTTSRMLEAAARVLRELPSVVTRSDEELLGVVRGPVHWPRTYQRQLATADRTRFICRPADRRFDTPLARLVKLALGTCVELTAAAGLTASGDLGSRLAANATEARRLLGHRKLTEVTDVHLIPERTLAGCLRYRHAAPIVEYVRTSRGTVALLDPDQVRNLINTHVLAPSSDDRLFELLCGFEMADAFAARGYKQRYRLIEPATPFAEFEGPEPIRIYWQRSLWSLLPAFRFTSRYRHTLHAAGMKLSALRPDFVLLIGHDQRPVMVEVKQTIHETETPERRGIVEAMAYLHDASDALPNEGPHAIVIAWNATGEPAPSSIVVADQHSVSMAIDVLLQ